MTSAVRVVVVAVAATLAHAPAFAQKQGQAQKPQDQTSLTRWAPERLYREGWSAEQMLETDVRADNGDEIGEVKDIIVDKSGRISKVVVEVGGFLELGDQHIGVPWKDVTIGRDMEYVEVPLKEVESGTYSLFGRVPQGEDVQAALTSWRVNELIGDYASLKDVPRYGIVTDVIFNKQGEAQGVVVARGRGAWGEPGDYAYPWRSYEPDRYAYALPYERQELRDAQRFDYVKFGELSRTARAPEERQSGAGATRNSSRRK